MTIILAALILIGLAMLFMSIRMDKIEKKMDDYNELVRLMADHNVQLREKDDKVLNLLTRTLDNVQENAESAKSAMCLCTDILNIMKGEQDKGEWIDSHTTCSKCGWQMIDDVTQTPNMVGFNYCPNCGTDMMKGDTNERTSRTDYTDAG